MSQSSDSVVLLDRATEILRTGLKNSSVSLTDHQRNVIKLICLDQRDVLYIDRTGAGKSEAYFVVTKLLREFDSRAGPVIVVTPFVSLIHDQVRRAKLFGFNASGYFSRKKGMTEWEQAVVKTKLGKNELDLLFITAEMLHEISLDSRTFTNDDGVTITYTPQLLCDGGSALKRFPPAMDSLSWTHIPLLVIDEIHYIAEAGHSFRVEYATVWSKIANHPWFQRARKLGLTATVNGRVRQSMIQALPSLGEWENVLGNLYRENITLRVLAKPAHDNARLDYVFQLYKKDESAYILVFCKTIEDVKRFAGELVKKGVKAEAVSFYYSPSNSAPKEVKLLMKNEEAFRRGTVHVLFCTCALGLGYDKSNIDHVVHMWTPNSIVQYYQEFGRVSRSAGSNGTAHMLPTSPWNPNGWAAVLSSICWFLARKKSFIAEEKEIYTRSEALRHKDSDVKRAIELGVKKNMLALISNGHLQLVDAKNSLQVIDKLFAEQMKDEVRLMSYISNNCGQDPHCLWKIILSQFEGRQNEFLTCNKCSGLACSPGGDISPSFQNENVVYQIIAPQSKIPIFALNKIGERLVVDEERLKEIFSFHRPSMVTDPPGKWTICPIPDSNGENESDAENISACLNGIEVNTFIQKNPNEHRTVTNACSQAERRDVLLSKFIFDWDRMPKIGNVLLYDDKVSSGDTIDSIVLAMRNHVDASVEFAALTKFVFIGTKRSSPEVIKFAANNPNKYALEQKEEP